ncbi:GLPGLI family protein [Zunongwangia mangrovi]|uniref:GLPGLI family protein n=1 Tax=Zunongwangia mangrovi TaxID=1334022 RepID=A0A1I1DV04_9FLAO|nr:GLPGLI family protein [Zunongwangia mangrovi]SFB78711.1 GLPGLI family protein [Zunongwangia mangrovi]
MKRVLLISIILNLCFCANAQSLKITYKIDYPEERKDLSKIENMMVRKYMKNRIAALPYVELILLIQGKSSKFYTEPKMPFENRDMQSGYNAALVLATGKRVFYKEDSLKFIFKDISGESYRILANKEKYNSWEITKEHKMILGYKCFKAKIEYKTYDKYMEPLWVPVEAWFTPEISVSTGPLDFDGLPGLILEATWDKRIIYFATKIESREDIKIEIPTAKKTITYQERDTITKKILMEIKRRSEMYGTEF